MKNFYIKECEMVDECKDGCIPCKPTEAIIIDPGECIGFIAISGRKHTQYPRPHKRHQNGGSRMHAQGVGEQINTQSQEESSHQQHPSWSFKGHEQYEEHVKVRIEVSAQQHIIQQQDLHQDDDNKTYNISCQKSDHCSSDASSSTCSSLLKLLIMFT